MKELLLDPIDMTEELMFHMFNNDMNRELDGRWLDLYLSLQLYKEHLETLDDISIQTLIDHYLSVREKLPDNLTVRDRLVELQQELLNRTTTNE